MIPPRALGPPLPLDDATLDQQATVTPTDVAAAQLLWRRLAPAWSKDLLDAQAREPDG